MTSQAASELPLSSFFKGQLDEVAIFARQLGPSEVAELVGAAAPRYKSLVQAYVANRPKAWWRLGESAGETEAIDEVGRQHGTYNVIGPAFFDGDDFIDLGAFDLDGAFTILAQVKPRSFAVSDARIIAKENGLDEAEQFWSLSTTIREDQARLRFRLRTDNGTREAVSSDRSINVNEQVFVAVVYDGKMLRLYQDGELVSELAHHGRPMTNAHCHVWIGDSPSGVGKRPFDGDIRDVAILPEAASGDHIRAVFHAARAAVEASPPPSPSDLAAGEPTEPLPIPPPSDPVLVEPPLAAESARNAPATPFVHRCPLCDVRYRDVLIHRVVLPGTVSLPICEAPIVLPVHP